MKTPFTPQQREFLQQILTLFPEDFNPMNEDEDNIENIQFNIMIELIKLKETQNKIKTIIGSTGEFPASKSTK